MTKLSPLDILDMSIVSSQESDHQAFTVAVRATLDTLPVTTSLADIWDTLGIESELIQDARFVTVQARAPDALMVMAQNHRAMSKLLLVTGQKEAIDDPAGTHITTYDGGLIVKSSDILKECAWSLATYRDKSLLYEWAQLVAHKSWLEAGK